MFIYWLRSDDGDSNPKQLDYAADNDQDGDGVLDWDDDNDGIPDELDNDLNNDEIPDAGKGETFDWLQDHLDGLSSLIRQISIHPSIRPYIHPSIHSFMFSLNHTFNNGFIHLFIHLIHLETAVEKDCVSGWTAGPNGACYFFPSHPETERGNFHQANTKCRLEALGWSSMTPGEVEELCRELVLGMGAGWDWFAPRMVRGVVRHRVPKEWYCSES